MVKRRRLKPKLAFYMVILIILSIIIGIAILNLLQSFPKEENIPDEPVQQFQKIQLDQGLVITDYGNYAGMYMEDGSNDTVSDVMMIIVENTAEQDLQYAQIQVVLDQEVREFEISNLSAGSQAVLLEQNRLSLPDNTITSASAQNIVFFDETMNCFEDVIEISGASGMMNIRNTSKSEIRDVVVYYKYCLSDLYYGGITFRVRVDGSLSENEVYQASTGHYDPSQCQIVMVTYSE